MIITMINDLGVDPNEWFDPPHPHDSMPIATDKSFDWEDTAPSEYEPPYEEMPSELMEVPTSVKNPKPQPKKEKTMHERMYEIATSKYNPFSVGGSESIHDFEGGSENVMS
tara:strand:- start:229 stop:561 length:333 start_codon:yes stop_codon:yes gene_type:complete